MIELKDISKSYVTGTFVQKALDDVSITFRESEFVAVLGPSGSGKTTLLNILGGLDHADEGDIVINGISTKQYRSSDWDTYRNHRIGFIFQSYNLIPHQTILSNVELALTLAGVDRVERRNRSLKALEDVGLGEHADKRPSQLSGGQMQRVAIARALVNDPDIVLADEPTGALDTETGVQVMDILAGVARDRLVIMVTHNPELAQAYATRIVRLADGRITDDSNAVSREEQASLVGETPVEEVSADATTELPAPVPSPEKGRKKRASMNFATALSLSFNNLMTKKGRTFLTAFAGSIGIIGIAAILALSNGVNNYIAKVEEDTLSSYPLSITKSSTDLSGLLGSTSTAGDTNSDSGTSMGSTTKQAADSGTIPESTILSDMFAQIKSNDLSSFKTYLESGQSDIDDYVSTITYDYGITPQIYKADTSSGVVQLNPSTVTSSSSATASAAESLGFTMGSSGSFEEMLDDQDLLDSQYDVIAGRWPSSYDECVLVLGRNGTISDYTLYNIGILNPNDLQQMLDEVSSSERVEVPDANVNLSYDDALALSFKVVDSSSLYSYNSESGTWTDMTDNTDYMTQAIASGIDLKVVGVIRPNDTTDSAALKQGVAYTHALTTRLMDDAASSEIVRQQVANPDVDVFTGKTFEELQSQNGGQLDMSSLFTIDEDALASAFSIDTSSIENAANIDASDLSSSMDTSSLSSLLANMPMPTFSDVNATLSKTVSGNANLTEEQQKQVSTLSNRLMMGFMTWLAQNGGLTEDTDFSAKFQEYLASSTDARGQVQAIAAIVGQATTTQMQEQVESAIETSMQNYMTNTFTPYLQNVMQQMVSQMASSMAETLQSSMGSISDAMGNAVSIDPDAFANAIQFNMTQEDLTSLLTNYMNADKLTYDNNLTKLGYALASNPSSINIYPTDFDSKEHVLDIIADYNQQMTDQGKDDQVISYSDIMGTLISNVTDIVNMISLVLIAFVSISLVVSSIMIGIITYISVLERKKEIGILRAMGASKRNIANVFNAETVIEGLIAGVFAIVVVLIVSVPVNAYVLGRYHVDTIMSLPWTSAFALIGISVLLTFVAGLIPSTAASRRDPVEALRSE